MNRARSRIGVVFQKELGEIFRDKRTIFGVVLGPLIITPLLFLVLGILISRETRKLQSEELTVGIVNLDHAPTLAKALGRTPNLILIPVPESSAEAQVKARTIRAAALLPLSTEADLAANKAVQVRILLDAGNEKSTTGAARLRAALQGVASGLLRVRLERLGLPPDFATPFSLTDAPIKTGGGRGTLIVASLLPYMLALACFSSGIYAANDTVAGEKERGTLETLLVSPATRRELVLGKFLSVAAVCCIGSFLSVVGMIIPFFSGLKAFEWLSKGGMHVTPAGIGVTLLMQVPLAALFAGLLLTVSTIARSQKEAQTYLGPMMMAILVPAMMSMFTGSEAPRALALVPILNASLIIKQALTGTTDTVFLALAVAAATVYAAIAVALCTRMFERESVLLRT